MLLLIQAKGLAACPVFDFTHYDELTNTNLIPCMSVSLKTHMPEDNMSQSTRLYSLLLRLYSLMFLS